MTLLAGCGSRAGVAHDEPATDAGVDATAAPSDEAGSSDAGDDAADVRTDAIDPVDAADVRSDGAFDVQPDVRSGEVAGDGSACPLPTMAGSGCEASPREWFCYGNTYTVTCTWTGGSEARPDPALACKGTSVSGTGHAAYCCPCAP